MRALIALVVVMSLAIVAGVTVLGVTVAHRMAGKPVAPSVVAADPAHLDLPAGSRVLGITGVGDRLALHIGDSDGREHILTVDPLTGARLGTLDLGPSLESRTK